MTTDTCKCGHLQDRHARLAGTNAHCIQKNPDAAYGRCGCGMYRPQDAEPAAVLPAPADRAAVLREAAVELRKQTLLHDDCVCVGELRRMADEARPAQPLAVDRDTVERALDLLREGNHITARLLLESATSPADEAQQAGESGALKRAHVALAEQAGRDQAALARVRALHDNLVASGELTSPDDSITRGAAARRIAAALDGRTEAQTCGAWGGCTLPAGHNMGHADIPENHSTGKAQQAGEGR